MRDVSAFTQMTTGNKRLLLFDIDGTLVSTGGAGVRALKLVIEKRYGVHDDLHDIEIAGRTDSGIAASILKKYGTNETNGKVTDFLDEYIGFLQQTVSTTDGQVLPGMSEILTRMKTRPDRVLGLLTGNIKRGAELKLQHYGLWDFFEFGAFADDHHDRNQLGEFARARAKEKHGHDFDAAQIDVIGDTGHDVACGKAFGARTVAIATGSWSREQLAAHKPDFLFDDLANVGEVMRVLGW
ncbi:MAG TPA: HAD hydrolase-like protein [Chthoniobacterales bacterium]|nr:HAD hydrolase-like protein [Chthoniobacterales bacterium]